MYDYIAVGNNFNYFKRKEELLSKYNIFPNLIKIKSYEQLDKLFFEDYILIRPHKKNVLNNIQNFINCSSKHFVKYNLEKDFYWYKRIQGSSPTISYIEKNFNKIIKEKTKLYSQLELTVTVSKKENTVLTWFKEYYFVLKELLPSEWFKQLSFFLATQRTNLTLIHSDFTIDNLLVDQNNNWIILDVEDLQYGIQELDSFSLNPKDKKVDFELNYTDIHILWFSYNLIYDIFFKKIENFDNSAKRYLTKNGRNEIKQRIKNETKFFTKKCQSKM